MEGPPLSRQPFWEDAYSAGASDPFGSASAEVVGLLDHLAPGSTVLDLGCGMGRNAIPLARAGMRVMCVDVSEAACARLRETAGTLSLDMGVVCEDALTFEFSRAYDVVIAHGMLHLFPCQSRQQLLARIKAHTLPGGLNVVAVFTDRLPAPPDMADEFVGLFGEGELSAAYADWIVELDQAYTLNDEHGGGLKHEHPVNKLVARKPSAFATAC
jgi:tellurite methyltransferase